MKNVPFNNPPVTGEELRLLEAAIADGHLCGAGRFSGECEDWIAGAVGAPRAFLAQSCTAALEMAVLLAGIEPGDEVIMPSFTFVSTANAVVLSGGVPVFVDIRPDTMNLDEGQVEAAITPRTKAIFVVHYGGVCAEMDALSEIARRHGVMLVEDAAHAFGATYRGRPAGGLADLGCFSFHATKNIISGEGGALTIMSDDLVERAEIIREKGTNRSRFLRGQVDKYTWVDKGSSYLPSELTAAFLRAQLERAGDINADRVATWNAYNAALDGVEKNGLRRPVVPDYCEHNGHLYYLLAPDRDRRDAALAELQGKGVIALFHYVPLHSSPAGQRFGRMHGNLAVTDDVAGRLLRLPLWYGMDDAVRARVIDAVLALDV